MGKENIYLALVDSDFELTEEVLGYFRSKEVEVVKYLKNVNVLQLRSKKDLTSEKLKYINHVEKEQTMRSGSEEDKN